MRKLSYAIVVIIALILANSTEAFQSFHGGSSKYPKLDYDSLFANAELLSKSAEGQKIIENCLQKYGGKDNLKKLHSYRMVLSMALLMTNDTITVEKSFSRNKKYKIDRHGKNGLETRILNNKSAWFIGRDTLIDIDGGRYCAELFSYLTMAMPYAMVNESFSEVRYGSRADDTLGYVYMKKGDSLMIVLGIDKNAYTINSSEGVVYQDTLSFVFVNKFSDFQREQKYLFPRSIVNVSMGLEVGRSRVTAVEINPAFKPDEFQTIPPSQDDGI